MHYIRKVSWILNPQQKMDMIVFSFCFDQLNLSALGKVAKLGQDEIAQVVDKDWKSLLRAEPNVEQRHWAILESKLLASNLQSP